MSKVS